MQCAGAIIAGGRGRRFGSPHKALARLPDGSCAAERVVRALRDVGCAPLIISSNDPAPYAHLGLPVVTDQWPDCGPLGGIASVLQQVAPLPLCIVAGDMPGIRAEHLRRLLAAWDGRLTVAYSTRVEPLCALISAALLPDVLAAVAAGDHGVVRLWTRLRATLVPFAASAGAAFADIDTPDDVARCQ